MATKISRRKKKKTSGSKKNILYIITAVAAIFLIGIGVIFKRYVLDKVTDTSFFIYIDENSSLDSVSEDLQKYLEKSDVNKIRRLSKLNGYTPWNKPGAYRIDPEMNAIRIYRKLSTGSQTPIRFTFNNIRTKDDLAETIDKQLKMDKQEVLELLNDSAFCTDMGFDTYTIPVLFLPDSYEVYWTIAPRKLMEKMRQEYDRFWTDDRRMLATQIGITPIEVSTLASIVEEETKVPDEMNMVAGLYLNRLKKGMPLQADPTVKYAVGDYSIRRILHEHLTVNSPYNTYKNTGLPPGPIRIPSKAAIKAVLNYRHHPFIYMCAKEDFSGRHNFATTYAEHQNNAIKYHKALNKRNILK